jgi:hypothetical protein
MVISLLICADESLGGLPRARKHLRLRKTLISSSARLNTRYGRINYATTVTLCLKSLDGRLILLIKNVSSFATYDYTQRIPTQKSSQPVTSIARPPRSRLSSRSMASPIRELRSAQSSRKLMQLLDLPGASYEGTGRPKNGAW